MISNVQMIKLCLGEEKDHTISKWQSWEMMSNHLILSPASLIVLTWDGAGIRITEELFQNAHCWYIHAFWHALLDVLNMY